MSINIYAMQDLSPADLDQVAAFVSDYTNGPGGLEAKLLPLNPEEVASRTGFIACEGATFRGYAGASAPLPGEENSELGPFIVVPESRRSGIGRRLLSRVTYAVLEESRRPYVFGNAANMGNLTRMGFVPATVNDALEAPYGLCVTKCPFVKVGEPCCNTPVILKGEPRLPDEVLSAWPKDRALQMPAG